MELIFVIICGLAALVVGVTTVLYLNDRSRAESPLREESSVRGRVHAILDSEAENEDEFEFSPEDAEAFSLRGECRLPKSDSRGWKCPVKITKEV